MKTTPVIRFVLLLVAVFSFISCEKEETSDPNQPLIDLMKAATDSVIQNTEVPGVVALVVDHKRGINWMYTAGYSDIANKLPMDSSYTFRIGSNTKTFTGTVLLQLVDEGKLVLEDKLSKYYPLYPKADSITIAMLCNMTSGVFNYTDDETWLNTTDANPTRVWTPQELVNAGFSNNFYFSPGKSWQYSNTNTIILGMLIEKLTGNTLEEEIETRIVNPLKLQNTGLMTSGTDLPGKHGRGYYGGKYVENEDLTNYIDVSVAWAAGSAYSTPRELQKYVETMVEGGFITTSLQTQRISDIKLLAPKLGYGLCLLQRGSFYGHDGSIPGFTSTMYHSKEKNCTVIIYFNCQLEDIRPDMLFYSYMNILYGENY